MNDAQREGRDEKAARRAQKTVTFYNGTVTELVDATHCKVEFAGMVVKCNITFGITVSEKQKVRVRAIGGDYLVEAVLSSGYELVEFTTTSPAGAGWYELQPDGRHVEVYYASTDSVPATTAVDIIYLPAELWPPNNVPIPAVSGTSPRQASSEINPNGRWRVYNGQTSATTVFVHGSYRRA